jgi:diguanylate cyclase (GGDEF)-like protein
MGMTFAASLNSSVALRTALSARLLRRRSNKCGVLPKVLRRPFVSYAGVPNYIEPSTNSRREPGIRQDLHALRTSASRLFVPLLWLHVPVIAGIAVSNGIPVWRPAAFMALAAAVATIAVWRAGGGLWARLTVAAALTAAPTLMVYAGTGPWQVDWHMYFFVVFGMLVAYVDWRPIALAAGLTAAHHAILDALFPSAVFPESDLARVALHASIVVVDSVVLFWIVHEMTGLFRRIAHEHQMLEDRIGERTLEVSGLNVELAGKVSELQGAFAELERDAAERELVSEHLAHLAHHDRVTGLPNRALLMDRMSVALANAQRAKTDLLVMYLDLDDFKQINDTLGHATGDEALASIAVRLRECIRSGDTASCVGGDEFVIVCATNDAGEDTAQLARRILNAVSEPIVSGSRALTVTASIGISVFPADGTDAEDLIARADAAMYRAKGRSPNSYAVYTAALHAEILAQSTLKADLERAIARHEFVVHYQPVISLTSKAIIGAEALVRWQHPTRGILAPGAFIQFAEENDLIAPIGEAVMHAACAQLNRFLLGPDDEFTMAVNVSAVQFRQPGFIDSMLSVLAEHRIDPLRFEVELTESAVMHDTDTAVRTLAALHALGIKLSIDDFGTGYSSLAYIKIFPIQTLKIDRSFVTDIAESATDQAIAATIITLAHNLGMRVIAEGIETEAQFDRVRALGADDMQGYWISRPLPGPDFERFVCARGSLRVAA